MISCDALERPGWWRWAGLALVFACALAPVLPLLTTLLEREGDQWLGTSFGPALNRSVRVALCVAAMGLLAGWPCGMLAGVYRFPLRRLLLAVLLLPLLAPPFLWALGFSMSSASFGLGRGSFFDGFTGTVLAFQGMAFPLVLFVSLAATRGISAGQSGMARLAGGERCLIGMIARQTFGPALLAALLVGGMSLADPGPGQILGYEGAASQILVSFSAQYDFSLAARQCLVVTGAALIVVLPVSVWLAPEMARGLLARDVHPAPLLASMVMGRVVVSLLAGATLLLIVLPAAGLILPITTGFRLERVMRELTRTAGNTLVYGGVAAAVAVGLGTVAAICAGRRRSAVAILLAGMMLVLALPPSLGALGLVHVGSDAPASLDPMLRSRFTAGLWLGLRLFPVAALFLLRRMGESSPSWSLAAAVHGMSVRVYFVRVLLPWLTPAALIGAAAVVLLAIADIHSVLLLHPPGQTSLPLAIFTVMANAPESLVASLCLTYLGGAAALMTAAAVLTRHFSRNS